MAPTTVYIYFQSGLIEAFSCLIAYFAVFWHIPAGMWERFLRMHTQSREDSTCNLSLSLSLSL